MKRNTTLARFACFGIALTLVFSLVLLIQQPSSSGKTVSVDTATSHAKGLVNSTNNKKVKLIKGEALRLRTEKLRSRNKGLDRAMKEFAKRNRSPRWEDSLSVQRVTEKSARNQGGASMQPAAFSTQTYDDGTYQIDFITYDGDYNHWEGIVFVKSSTGGETYSGDILTPSNDGTGWDVKNEAYYPPDGGDPSCESGPCPVEGPVARSVDKHGKSEKLVQTSHHPGPPRPLFGWLRRWWGCVTNVCGWSDFLCTGNSRFFCRVGYCVYGVFACI
jgi:hypothetical protein